MATIPNLLKPLRPFVEFVLDNRSLAKEAYDYLLSVFNQVTALTDAINSGAGGVGDHEVVVHTGNGYGSTNTQIRRYSTILNNVGTAITYADSATLGGSFTINETGIYSISSFDLNVTNNSVIGISVNSTQLTTNIAGINIANRVALVAIQGAPGLDIPDCSRVVKLNAGDVIRSHQDAAAANSNGDNRTFFSIRKIGVI